MVVVTLALLIVAVAINIYQAATFSKSRNENVQLITDKESIIHSLQLHITSLENLTDAQSETIKRLKSELQSSNDKLKARLEDKKPVKPETNTKPTAAKKPRTGSYNKK